jgi:hypothetical protein
MIFFGSIFEFLFFLYLANNYVKLNYEEQYNKLIICSIYNFFYYFSFAQIKITKILTVLNDKYLNFIKSNPQLLECFNKLKKTEKIIHNIEYISNNFCIFSDTHDIIKQLHQVKSDKIPIEFDFIIYTDNNSNNNNSNNNNSNNNNSNNNNNRKLILDELSPNDNLICEETRYKFVLIEITIYDKTIKIDLKTDKYNFMIVNNKLDTLFINYFIQKYYNYDEISKLLWFDYKLKILDQNVNEIILDSQQELILNLDNYSVIKLNNISTKIIELSVDELLVDELPVIELPVIELPVIELPVDEYK